MKKIKLLLLPIFLFSFAFADGDIVNQTCAVSGETEFFPIGDERGHSVLTEKQVLRDCNVTITVQGSCKKWEENVTEKWRLNASNYNVYTSKNYQGTIGQMFANVAAYDQLGHLWSGWKGFCYSGLKMDFSWASDPMFWGSLALSYAMDSAAAGQAQSAQNAAKAEKAAQAAQAAGTSETAAVQQTEQQILAQQAQQSAMTQSLNSVNQAAADTMTSASTAAGNAWVAVGETVGLKLSQNFGKCLVSAGINMALDLYSYFGPDDNIPCDPVDNFCNDKTANDSQNTSLDESNIMTMDLTKFNDMLKANPDFQDYITVLKTEDGIVTYKFKPDYEVPGFAGASQIDQAALREKIKKMQLYISTAMVAGQMAACGLSNGSIGTGVSVKTANDDGRLSLKNGASMAIGAMPVQWLGPYGPLIKAGLQVALQFATSFEHVDSCNNEQDALTAGTRHQKTFESLKYGLCKEIATDCQQHNLIGTGCALHGYYYCCYDQKMTKILIEQMKAELAMGWKHCTGITLRDLNYISFRQCTPAEMKDGFDGAKVIIDYDFNPDINWEGSFQYKHHCMDLTEFKNYLAETVGGNIDMSDFDEMFSDTKEQKSSMGY